MAPAFPPSKSPAARRCAGGGDLRMNGLGRLAAVAAELNDRPRKTLGWNTPTALLAAALAQHDHS